MNTNANSAPQGRLDGDVERLNVAQRDLNFARQLRYDFENDCLDYYPVYRSEGFRIPHLWVDHGLQTINTKPGVRVNYIPHSHLLKDENGMDFAL